MKFRGHETFSIRKGWLNKGIKNVKQNPSIFVSKEENPMDIFGIGSNMVKSLRYWLQATNLTSEPSSKKRNQTLTDLGNIIYNSDPYFEEIGSLWLVHYELATNKELATSWYIFFNELDSIEFNEDDFYRKVRKYVTMIDSNKIPASRTVNDDFKCIINTYFSKTRLSDAKINPEDNVSCPLTELGLIDYVTTANGMRVYRKVTPNIDNIPNTIAMAILIKSVYDKDEEKEKGIKIKEIKISTIQNDRNNLGKVFNLDTISLLNLLYRLESEEYIKVVRTAGLDVIRINTDISYLDCVKKYYNELNEN